MNILLAEDETELLKPLCTILTHNGYEVTSAKNGKEAYDETKNKEFDVIILDIMMPVMTGIEALKEIRKNGVETPVLLLTAKSEIDDKINGLDSGADDYLTKPFNMRELLARLRVLTRKKSQKQKNLEMENILLNPETSEISSEIASLRLNGKEYSLMETLLCNKDKLLKSKSLKEEIWKDEEADDATVELYISYLQRKLEAIGAKIEISAADGYTLQSK